MMKTWKKAHIKPLTILKSLQWLKALAMAFFKNFFFVLLTAKEIFTNMAYDWTASPRTWERLRVWTFLEQTYDIPF